jgi:hypothetical protein
MAVRVRMSLCKLAFVFGVAIVSAGCDAGGLLIGQGQTGGDKPPAGPSATELVNGGNYASNGQYRLFYTLGQPTPHQGVAKGEEHRNNGGLAGAVHSK